MSGCLICKIRKKKIGGVFLYFNAFLCLIWLLLRSGTNPSRIKYPCQQYAFSQAMTIPLFAGILSGTKIEESINKRKILFTISLLILMLVSMIITRFNIKNRQIFNINASSGAGLCQNYTGIDNGKSKVVEIYDNLASNYPYDGSNYFNYINQEKIDLMMKEGLLRLTGKSSINEALANIFPNYQFGKAVAIKVNLNDYVHDLPDSYYNTEPQTVRALVSLLVTFGIRQEDVWIVEGTGEDTKNDFPSYFTSIIKGNQYPNVRFYRKGGPAGYDCNNGKVSFSYIYPYSPRCPYSCITSAITNATYFVDIPIIKAIRTKWGITGAIKSMQGVTNNQYCNHDPVWNQSNVEPLDIDDVSNPLVSVYKNVNIVGKKRLIIASGILGNWTGFHFDEDGTTQNIPRSFITKGNKPLNTMLFSFDPVAIDSVSLNMVVRERVARVLACVNAPIISAAGKAGLGTFEVFSNGTGSYNLINYEYRDINQIQLSPTPTPTTYFVCSNCPSGVPSKNKGNANCDRVINSIDFALWKKIYLNPFSTEIEKAEVDFDCVTGNSSRVIDTDDFKIWAQNWSI